MTNDEALNAVNAMTSCHETGRLGYAIAKNLTKLKSETAEYAALRDELLTKYGTAVMKDGKATGTFSVAGESLQRFRDELGDVPDEQIDFKPYQVDEDVFLAGSLDSAQMTAMLWMVKDDGNGAD